MEDHSKTKPTPINEIAETIDPACLKYNGRPTHSVIMDAHFLFLVARGKLNKEVSNANVNPRKLLGHLALVDAIFHHLATSQEPTTHTESVMELCSSEAEMCERDQHYPDSYPRRQRIFNRKRQQIRGSRGYPNSQALFANNWRCTYRTIFATLLLFYRLGNYPRSIVDDSYRVLYTVMSM